MYIFTVVLLVLAVCILSYLLYIQYRKYQKATQYCEAYVQFLSALYFQFIGTRDHIKQIDRLGAFKADDEVGFIFTEIDQSIDDLYNFLTKYVNTTTEEEKAKD